MTILSNPAQAGDVARGNQGRGGGRCYICDRLATRSCDGAVEGGRKCERPICDKHAIQRTLSPTRMLQDFCPVH